MFIGSRYTLTNPDRSIIGYESIVVKERVLSRTEERVRFIDPGEASVTVTAYCYTLMCLVNDGDSAEISEDEFQEEIMSGYYDLTGWGV